MVVVGIMVFFRLGFGWELEISTETSSNQPNCDLGMTPPVYASGIGVRVRSTRPVADVVCAVVALCAATPY